MSNPFIFGITVGILEERVYILLKNEENGLFFWYLIAEKIENIVTFFSSADSNEVISCKKFSDYESVFSFTEKLNFCLEIFHDEKQFLDFLRKEGFLEGDPASGYLLGRINSLFADGLLPS